MYSFSKSYEAIFNFLLKDENKNFDYYIFDSFYDIQEMNKV